MRTTFIVIFLLATLPLGKSIGAESGAWKFFKLDSDPGVALVLDREYVCLETKDSDPAKQINARSYLFTPTDGDSGLIFQIGPDANVGTREMLKKTNKVKRITKTEGAINGNKVEWLHGTDDENRFFSTVTVTLKDASGTERLVAIWIVGSTRERRESLERCLATIKFP